MKEQMIKATAITSMHEKFQVYLTIPEIERAYEEAQRIKAENRIETGTIVFHKPTASVRKIIGFDFSGLKKLYQLEISKFAEEHEITKIINPAHIQALNEIYEGMK